MTQDSWEWNAPPGWPPMRPDWQPEEGWMPDSSWPSPPKSWKFWIRKSESKPWLRAFVAAGSAIGVGLASIVIFGFSVPERFNAIAIFLGLAAASFGAAGLLGFLFGVPRKSTETPATTGLSILPNTNLEQVSDWLTKVLLGATLTQFGNLTAWFGSRFSDIGNSIGDAEAGSAFAGVVAVYFASTGFLVGWLATRLYLGRLMQEADEKTKTILQVANKVEDGGNPELAQEIRFAVVAPNFAAEYERLRSNQPSSWARTRKFEANYEAQMRVARQNMSLSRTDAVELFNSGTDGNRITALAFMEGRSELVDMEVVSQAIKEPASAFEQYHALVIADKRLRQSEPLDKATKDALSAAIDAGYESGRFEGSHDRQKLATRIRDHLNAE